MSRLTEDNFKRDFERNLITAVLRRAAREKKKEYFEHRTKKATVVRRAAPY